MFPLTGFRDEGLAVILAGRLARMAGETKTASLIAG